MSSKLTLKNDLNTEFSIIHNDGSKAKTIASNDMVQAVDTIADMVALLNCEDGQVAIVRDDGRGGTFIWSATGTANAGTVFAGATGYWNRQYDGAVNVKWFGVIGDGTTDDDTSWQSAVTFIKANGGILEDTNGLQIKCASTSLTNPTKTFAIVGVKGKTKLIRKDDTVGTMIASSASSVPFYLSNFDIDCKNDIYPTGNHGISIADMNGLRMNRVTVSNYKNSAILVYGTVPNTFYDNIITDCKANGMTVANNGILIAEMDRSGLINCEAYDIAGSPAYGLQLKNRCNYSFIHGGYVKNCIAGVAFGQDISTKSVSNCSVSNVKVFDCTSGFLAGYAEGNTVDMIIDMNSTDENGIDLDTCIGNKINATVKNVAALKSASRFRTGSTDNTVTISMLDNINTTGVAAIFDSGSLRNSVTVNKMRLPSTPTTVRSLVSDSSSGTNTLEFSGMKYVSSNVITAGVITITQSASVIAVDTEAAAASDTLDTISGALIDGNTITLRSSSNVRDVTVSHNTGNILLNGSANYTLDAVADTLTLMYNSALSKWCEIARGNNT